MLWSCACAVLCADVVKVVKTTVFLKDMNDFNAVNEVYAEVWLS